MKCETCDQENCYNPDHGSIKLPYDPLRGLDSLQSDVMDFHEKFGLELNRSPTQPSENVIRLRAALISEECSETCEALSLLQTAGNDGELIDALAKVADGIIDSIYVLVGTAVSLGIHLNPIWNLVQQANMSKVGGGTREDGKILKPEGWKAPNVEGDIYRQIQESK